MTSASSNKLAALFPNAQDATVGDVVPEPVVFVEDLADRLATEFPDLWKLGQVRIMTALTLKIISISSFIRISMR